MGTIVDFQSGNELVVLREEGVFTTSLVIAEGTCNEHRAVLQLLRKYEADLAEFGRVAFEMQPLETAGGTQYREVSLLNEHQATFLLTLMRNSAVVVLFKKHLVKAFFAMAEKLATRHQVPQTLPEALRLAADLAEENARQKERIVSMIPKVEALDRIATSDGEMCVTNAAKALQVRPKDLFALMQARQWIYRRAGSNVWTAYQDKIQSGMLEHKVTTISRGDGSEKTVERVLVTPKGLTRLAGMVAA